VYYLTPKRARAHGDLPILIPEQQGRASGGSNRRGFKKGICFIPQSPLFDLATNTRSAVEFSRVSHVDLFEQPV